MTQDQIVEAALRLYEEKSIANWPRESFELMLAAFGLDAEKHRNFMIGVFEEDDYHWCCDELEKLIDAIL